MKADELKKLRNELQQATTLAAREEGKLSTATATLEKDFGVKGLSDCKNKEQMEKLLARARAPLAAAVKETESAFRKEWKSFASEYPDAAARIAGDDSDDDEDADDSDEEDDDSDED